MSANLVDTTEVGTYKRVFARKYAELEQVLEGLPDEALVWKPFETSPWQGPAGSIGWLAAHAGSSTVYLLKRAEWIAGRIEWDAVEGDEGSDEFGPANHDPAYLRSRLARTHAYVAAMLDSLTPDELAMSREHPQRPGLILTVRYDVQHAAEHMSQHIGHAQLSRQLWALDQA